MLVVKVLPFEPIDSPKTLDVWRMLMLYLDNIMFLNSSSFSCEL
jgi:hypothetical protein